MTELIASSMVFILASAGNIWFEMRNKASNIKERLISMDNGGFLSPEGEE
jgi:hypothetical protein